ncbi:hypothetical protein A2U01_0058597, partial [Trifolium medium]|nr:hypothetical protein [Trifolium medium]
MDCPTGPLRGPLAQHWGHYKSSPSQESQ